MRVVERFENLNRSLHGCIVAFGCFLEIFGWQFKGLTVLRCLRFQEVIRFFIWVFEDPAAFQRIFSRERTATKFVFWRLVVNVNTKCFVNDWQFLVS
jgi:hypothetical protein